MTAEFVRPDDELAGLAMFLDEQRNAILRTIDGLSTETAMQTPTSSSMSLLTIVKHMAYVERRWFQLAVANGDNDGLWPPTDPQEEWRIDPGESVDSIRSLYEQRVAESRAVMREVGSADDDVYPTSYGLNVRWVVLHMIEETARHAGHADIIRESLDGATSP